MAVLIFTYYVFYLDFIFAILFYLLFLTYLLYSTFGLIIWKHHILIKSWKMHFNCSRI